MVSRTCSQEATSTLVRHKYAGQHGPPSPSSDRGPSCPHRVLASMSVVQSKPQRPPDTVACQAHLDTACVTRPIPLKYSLVSRTSYNTWPQGPSQCCCQESLGHSTNLGVERRALQPGGTQSVPGVTGKTGPPLQTCTVSQRGRHVLPTTGMAPGRARGAHGSSSLVVVLCPFSHPQLAMLPAWLPAMALAASHGASR